MKTIAIIGGGFSGTITAVNLARLSQTPLRVCLINHAFPTGRGVAYSTRRPEHLLNVVARNMSALADHPSHFVEWLATRTEFADTSEATLREMFAPRRTYGDYLRGLLHWYSRPVDGRSCVQIDMLSAEVIDITPAGPHSVVTLAEGAPIEADKVVLATGNQPPCELKSNGKPFVHPAYQSTPWQDWESKLPDRDQPVILLGTGLTTVDAYLTLAACDWRGPIYAISRNGLLPLSHFKGIEYPDFPPADMSNLDLAGLAALVEEHCKRLRARGENPAIVVDKLRPHTQRLWQGLSVEDRREFGRRFRARWNVTRHRIAASIHDQVSQAMANGKLRIVKGNIRELADADGKVRVTIEEAPGQTRSIDGALVVNCTGPQESFTAGDSRLYAKLFERGLVVADDLDMGIRADADFAVIDSEGRVSDFLFALGPLLKGSLWETTAVPELRSQAFRLAQTLIEACGHEEPRNTWQPPAEADVLEYCI